MRRYNWAGCTSNELALELATLIIETGGADINAFERDGRESESESESEGRESDQEGGEYTPLWWAAKAVCLGQGLTGTLVHSLAQPEPIFSLTD